VKFREISFRKNFRFPGSFRENGYVSAVNIFKMTHSNRNLTILVHVHYCCTICFEAPSGFDNFERHGGQYLLDAGMISAQSADFGAPEQLLQRPPFHTFDAPDHFSRSNPNRYF
jgi:hypothetical protein